VSALDLEGAYLEDLEVGQQAVSPGRTITEADIVAFAGLSGDYNVVHTDAEHAKSTVFGERIAHGLLGLSIASGLLMRAIPVEGTAEAFLGLEWKFKGPIKIGDSIRVRMKVVRKRPMKALKGGIVDLDLSVVNQRDEVVQQGVWRILIRSRQEG
jgi:3-hydroxybutyryl-CoA dehydratase